jgi:hypothetical protein
MQPSFGIRPAATYLKTTLAGTSPPPLSTGIAGERALDQAGALFFFLD